MKTQHFPTFTLTGKWKETSEAHVFNADLKKEQVRVEIKDGRVLQISWERNVEKEDKNKTWHRVEHSKDGSD
ncbi:hypothetical protein NC653_031414 [Populus alba x Populus x berolinensis]|uniref:Uncharacterized protein n=1 Tax=Populus alba x Populus x berolinensis TaxID=444605 RepID=A0AAD6LYP4_9ROSI|nr:hypothetical protein NC653_031414 [Populus alba x Populus x berolinensis]